MSTRMDTIRRYAKEGLDSPDVRETALRMIINVAEDAEHEQPAPEGEEWVIHDLPGLSSAIMDHVHKFDPRAIDISVPQPPFVWGRTGIIVTSAGGTIDPRKLAEQIIRDHRLAALVPGLTAALKQSATWFHATHRNIWGEKIENCGHEQCEAALTALNAVAKEREG